MDIPPHNVYSYAEAKSTQTTLLIVREVLL